MESEKLILTELDRTINKQKNSTFLGKWCIDEIELYKSLDNFNIIEYHWDDRNKLKKDYFYLEEIHKRLLNSLTATLNDYHKVNRSKRFWQIILDPWLMDYVGIFYDRWESIRSASKRDKKFDVNFFEELNSLETAFSYQELSRLARTHSWNHALYQRIINFNFVDNFFIKINSKKFKTFDLMNLNKKKSSSIKMKIFIYLNLLYENIFSKIFTKYKVIFIDSYFSTLGIIKINLLFMQLPRNFTYIFNDDNKIEKYIDRNQLVIEFKAIDRFEEFIKYFIRNDLPKSALEYHDYYINKIDTIDINTKLIVSANSYWFSDIKKYWIAKKISEGVKLITTDHGGSFPAYEEHFKFEENISDKRATWFSPWHDKHIQMPPGKLLYLKLIKDIVNFFTYKKYCSFIGYSGSSRWAHRATFYPLSYQALSVYELSMSLYSSLEDKIKKNVKIRPQNQNGIDVKKLYEYKLGKEIISRKKNYYKFLFKSKIIVCLYPETTYSEAMALHIPTILIYPEKYFERNEISNELRIKMKNCNMLFSDPILAAKHINNIWSDPNIWWNEKETKLTRELFYKLAGKANDKSWSKKWKIFLENMY